MALFHRLMKIKRELGPTEDMPMKLAKMLVSHLCPGEIPEECQVPNFTDYGTIIDPLVGEYLTNFTFIYQ
jgi:hypothetical protein